MTVFVACKILKELELNPITTYMQVSKYASGIIGTSAHLQEG
jgi:hypothetical protein